MRRVAVLLLLLGGGGCVDGMAPSASVSSPDAAPMAEVSPTAQGGVAVDEQKRVAELVEQIKSDLASRQSLSVEQIQVVEVANRSWPDEGLGCAARRLRAATNTRLPDSDRPRRRCV